MSAKVLRDHLTDIGDDGHSLHKPVKLFLCNTHRFLCVSGPAKVSFSQPLIEQQIAVAFKDQSFNSVGSGSAEQKQYIFLSGIQIILALDDCGQAIDPFSEITSATDNDDLIEPFGIIQQGSSTPSSGALSSQTPNYSILILLFRCG